MKAENHWRAVTLGEVADVISGYAFSSRDFQQSGIPVVKISNIRVGDVDVSETACVDPKFLSLDRKYHVKYGDILISLTGSHLTQPNSVVGRIALFRDSMRHCVLNQRAGKIIVRDSSFCDSQFLFYLLREPNRMREIATMAHGAASQANVSPTQVGSLRFFLPSIHLQRKIASILSAYDNLIENNTRRIKVLEQMAQMLYREWFSASSVHHWPSGSAFTRDWQLTSIAEHVEITKGKKAAVLHDTPDVGTVPYLLIAGLAGGATKYAKPAGMVALTDNDVVMVMDGASSGAVSLGLPGVVGSTLARFRVMRSSTISPYFLLCFLLNQNEDIKAKNVGSAIPHANVDYIKGMTFALPPKEVSNAFHQHCSLLFGLVRILRRKNHNLQTTRDLLLPKLVSGEVNVDRFETEAVAQTV